MDADENLMMAGKLFFSLLRSLIVRTRVLEKTIRICAFVKNILRAEIRFRVFANADLRERGKYEGKMASAKVFRGERPLLKFSAKTSIHGRISSDLMCIKSAEILKTFLGK